MARPVHSRREQGEHRLPPSLAVLTALAVYGVMPSSLLFTPRLLVPAIEVALLVALFLGSDRRLKSRRPWAAHVSMGLAGLVIASNLASLGLLLHAISSASTSGQNLLLGAMQIWISNVIGFALLYWEIDRGGPVGRAHPERVDVPVDWSFPQDQDGGHDWWPIFVDYLYVSLTNSTAFSPTDTMPMTTRAKLLMGVQGMAALLVSLLVVARAVNTLTG